MKKALFCLFLVLVLLSGCAYRSETPLPEIQEPEEPPAEKLTFKEKAELNAQLYPAMSGKVLCTKGQYNFTGIDYYFKGEILQFNNLQGAIGDPSAWFVRNDYGYVMPIQHYYFEAEVGDIVEVWGTLSGNGYANAPGIVNVVGETGSMHAMLVTVNGEPQY